MRFALASCVLLAGAFRRPPMPRIITPVRQSISGSGPRTGGGYDTYGRLVARHLAKHIPGHPTIIVQNMDGASTRKAAGYVYNSSRGRRGDRRDLTGGVIAAR